ncbi:MAG: transporter [Gammaproteobacteria bacterium]
MKRPHLRPAVLLGLLCAAGAVPAGELGHYAPALPNVRDLLVPPKPGVYYLQYNYLYSTETLKNRNGDEVGSLTVDGPLGSTTVTVEPDIEAFAVAPSLVWVSPWHVFGARYAAFVLAGFVSASPQVSLSLARAGRFLDRAQAIDRTLEADVGGMIDTYFQPVWLGWSGQHYDASAAYGFYAPTGSDGVSLEFWEHQFQAAGAWYPWADKRMAVTLAGTYELPMEKDGEDLTPGDRFTLNWGVSQYLPLRKDMSIVAELGIRGYSQWQIQEDSGADVPQIRNVQLNAEDQIHSAGLQAGLTFPHYNAILNFAYMWDFGAEARFEGQWVGLTLAKGF